MSIIIVEHSTNVIHGVIFGVQNSTLKYMTSLKMCEDGCFSVVRQNYS